MDNSVAWRAAAAAAAAAAASQAAYSNPHMSQLRPTVPFTPSSSLHINPMAAALAGLSLPATLPASAATTSSLVVANPAAAAAIAGLTQAGFSLTSSQAAGSMLASDPMVAAAAAAQFYSSFIHPPPPFPTLPGIQSLPGLPGAHGFPPPTQGPISSPATLPLSGGLPSSLVSLPVPLVPASSVPTSSDAGKVLSSVDRLAGLGGGIGREVSSAPIAAGVTSSLGTGRSSEEPGTKVRREGMA